MSRPQIFHYDTLDDRREIHRLLQLLHPHRCIAWLDRQCQRCVGPHGTRPSPSKKMAERVKDAVIFGGDRHYKLATEIYFDFWMLAVQNGLDMDLATKDLEEMVKRQDS